MNYSLSCSVCPFATTSLCCCDKQQPSCFVTGIQMIFFTSKLLEVMFSLPYCNNYSKPFKFSSLFCISVLSYCDICKGEAIYFSHIVIFHNSVQSYGLIIRVKYVPSGL